MLPQGRIDPPKAERGHTTLELLYRGRNAGVLNLNQNLTRYDVDYGNLCLIMLKRCHTASLRDLNLVTASISPSIQDIREFHTLSPFRRVDTPLVTLI